MFPTKFLLVLALWLPLSNFALEASSGDVTPSTTSKCEYPCQQPSPPLPGYLPYVAPPPPPSPPPPSGYSIYEAPPPPPPQEKGQSKCPPTAGVECCTPPAPYTPPNPYSPVPYGDGQRSASMLLHVLVPLMMLFSSFIFLF